MSPIRRTAMIVVLSVVAGAMLAAGATTATPMKPVIGKPAATPSKPVAGKRFAVSYKVTRSDTGAPLKTGTMICDPSAAGKVIAHAESFKGGTARLSFIVPTSAKALKVKVMIKSGGKSATSVTNYKVSGAYIPTLTVADASVAEGNAGTATLSFPVTLSAKSTDTVSVSYATADGTATQPADYTAATGTLSFKPGETAKTVTVNVAGEMAYEPDETLTVTLSKPIAATIARGTATGTITNEDTLAMPGHYAGKTSQNEMFDFDVTPSGTEVTNVKTGQVNQSCSPDGTLSGGRLNLGSTYSIAADGSFAINVILFGTVSGGGGVAITMNRISIAGRFSGATASGTLLITTTFTLGGTNYSCTSNNQTWNVSRTG